MSTVISVRSTGIAQIASAPIPNTSVVTQATETVSVRSENAVVVQGAPTETVVQSQPDTLILNVETTSVEVISVNSPAVGVADIINRQITNTRAVNEFEVMINHEMFLEATGEIVLNGTDGETAGTLLLL